MDVSIVIVTYNSEKQIEACLNSVFSQTRGVTQEVVVVDNLSKDGTAALLQKRYPQVKLILPGANLGFARGVNLGAKHSIGDYILLLNPDTEVRDHAIDEVVAFARKHPEFGFYGGRNLKPDGSLEPSSCWGQPTLWSMAMFALGLSTVFRHNSFFDPESLGSWKRDTVREVGVITGCFLLARRDAWEKLRGMDERFFMYGEDVDFAMRAREAGYRPVLVPQAIIMHEVGASSDKPINKMMLLYKGKAALVRRHWKGFGRSLGLFFLVLGVGLRALPAWLKSLIRGGEPGKWHLLWSRRKEWLIGYPTSQSPQSP
ncbi:MAG: glycosyltransferase family 2 protein [Opitutaceae bacterium]|nr:glycosyltransferase family 2 protein [Opitutaceae bacterium]